jgi:SAM-dependent methyltransferase
MKGSYNSIAENTPDDGSGSNPPTPKGPQLEKTSSTAVLGGPSKNKDLISELKDKTDDAKPEDKKPAPERQTSSRFTNNAFIRQDSVSGNPPKETSHSRESSSSKDASSSLKPKEDDTKKSSLSSSSTTKSTSSSTSSEKDVAPRDSVEYSTKQYWESRYKQEDGTFDWFAGWDILGDTLKKFVKKDDKVLYLGCGNSELMESLYDEFKGSVQISNIDISETIIEKMKGRNTSRSKMNWTVMDVLTMSFSSGNFDVVIDKGTIDSIVMAQKGDKTKLESSMESKLEKMLAEVSKILKSNGTFFYVTFVKPYYRKAIFEKSKFNWTVTTQGMATENGPIYLYTMKKK